MGGSGWGAGVAPHPLSRGLDEAEATSRLGRVGPNALPPPRRPSVGRLALTSLREPLVLVLLAAMVLTTLSRDVTDTLVIVLVVIVNSAIGIREQLRAAADVEALRSLVPVHASVVRSGTERVVPAAELVPGDLVRLRAGDLVPADAVLVEGVGLRVDESVVTGESLDVGRQPAADPGPVEEPGTPPEAAMLRSGTVVVHGRGTARVVATGPRSTVGRIAALATGPAQASPLQRRMAGLSRQLAVVAVVLSAVYLVVGVVAGQPVRLVVLAAVALVVAAVPESLPLVVTVTLALAARRMARHQAVARSLDAVETLGAVTLLATDKTGTLTHGRLSLTHGWVPASGTMGHLADLAVLCNDASLDPATGTPVGNPVDAALLTWAGEQGRPTTPGEGWVRVGETPFDSTRKHMTTHHRGPDGRELTVRKGAPEVLLGPAAGPAAGPGAATTPVADDDGEVAPVTGDGERAEALAVAGEWAAAGSRVLAVTVSVDGGPPAVAGLLALADRVRDASRRTVEQCRAAGIRLVLVTGDHPGTATAVATEVGLREPTATGDVVAMDGRPVQQADAGASVVARARPEDKSTLVELWQSAGEVVAMTGDGVNDAPALRRADIGVAMGGRGTDVARQAADLVLTDDHLETVVTAVREGRRVFTNIRRFLLYGLSGGGSELVLMLAGPLAGVPVPLLPAQILWVNLLTHSFAGAGLGTQPVEPGTMDRPPRPPGQAVLGAGLWWRVVLLATWLGLASLAASLVVGGEEARSVALLCVGSGQLAVAWAARAGRTRDGWVARWRDELGTLAAGLVAAAALLAASVLVPPLRELLETRDLGPGPWLVVGVVALASYVVARVVAPRTW
ncbi:cation-translocating P-type ATPase [Pedococcus sp. NPDC057267]|uniref:cation-translocating P-type ATPase n=1 Tax=Pedococcus sp. NPDC057267 TaxID=3346077 RepID=UPI00363DFED9